MKILLYKSSAESHEVDKTSNLVLYYELNGYLREETDISTPEINVEYDTRPFVLAEQNFVLADGSKVLADKSGFSLVDCNYAYIEKFNRYYYITNIISLNSKLYRLKLKCDVLMSFKNIIKEQTCLVSRNEFEYSNFIKDSLLTNEFRKDVQEYTPNNLDEAHSVSFNGRSLIVTTIYTKEVSELKDQYIDLLSNPYLPPLYQTGRSALLLGGNNSKYVQAMEEMTISNSQTNLLNTLNVMTSFIITNSDLKDYVLSAMIFPFNVGNDLTPVGDIQDFVIKDDTIWGSTKPDLKSRKLKGGCLPPLLHYVFKINSDFSSFKDFEPYTKYEVLIPFYGWVDLPAKLIANKKIYVWYLVDPSSTNATVNVANEDSQLIFTGNCQIGVNVPITQTNYQEVERTTTGNFLNALMGEVSSAIMVAMGGNPISTMFGITSSIKTLSQFAANELNNVPTASCNASNGGYTSVWSVHTPRVRITKVVYNDETGLAHLQGKPLNVVKKLSTLKGFTQIGEKHLKGFDTATKTEIDEIDSLLDKGIIL